MEIERSVCENVQISSARSASVVCLFFKHWQGLPAKTPVYTSPSQPALLFTSATPPSQRSDGASQNACTPRMGLLSAVADAILEASSFIMFRKREPQESL